MENNTARFKIRPSETRKLKKYKPQDEGENTKIE